MKSPKQNEPNAEQLAARVKAKAFLAAYAKTGQITKAAEAAGIDRTLHYRWMQNVHYAAAFNRAREQAGDYLESEAVRRATEGTLEPVFYQGIKCGAVRRYSDGLMQFLLRGHKPDKYGPKLEISGTVNVAERLIAARRRVAEAQRKYGDGNSAD